MTVETVIHLPGGLIRDCWVRHADGDWMLTMAVQVPYWGC